MQKTQDKILHTDVLVIGAGGAGLRAAIAACEKNAAVLVLSKGAFPQDCNTAAAGGAMLAPLGKADSIPQYINDTMQAGGGLNYPHLVEVLAANAAQRALDLESYGVHYVRQNGEIRLWKSADCTVARALPGGVPYSGDWFQSLVQETQRLNIQVMDHFAVMDLVKDGDTITGAVGFEIMTGTFVTIMAKSVILATGGAGNIYAFTSNKPGITGDGLIMAYKAGACLSHLEFVQMRQCIIHPEGLKGMLPPFDGFVGAGGRFYNGLHERYMRRYHPEKMEAVTRAEIAKCAQLEIMAGRQSTHGGVYGDLSDVPEDNLLAVKKFMDACSRAQFDPTFQTYEWGPASHHLMGGVVISPLCETGVKGLFAAGEVAAGVQGANRMGGNALTETQVFGAIAGERAAIRAQTVAAPPPAGHLAGNAKTHLSNILKKETGVDHREVRAKITAAMSKYVGVIRNKDGLLKAQSALANIETNQIYNLCLTEDRSYRLASELLETENMLTLGQLMVQAALLRTESRGAHQRQDYPATDPKWEKHLVFQLVGHGPQVKEAPAAGRNA